MTDTNDQITLEDIRRVRDKMKRTAVKPLYVKSDAEARRFNRNDRELRRLMGISASGRHKWKKGDAYYHFVVHPFECPAPVMA